MTAQSSLDSALYLSSALAFSQPHCIGGFVSYPFAVAERSALTPLYSLRMRCAAGHYAQPAYKSTLSAELCPGTPYVDPEAYFLEDSAPADAEGGAMREWTRYYAAIPGPHSIPEGIAWTRPGINTLTSGESEVSVSATQVQSNPYSPSYDALVSVSSSSGFSVGDRIAVRYVFNSSFASVVNTGQATVSSLGGGTLGIENCGWISNEPPGTVFPADLVTLLETNAGGIVLDKRSEEAIVSSGYTAYRFYLDPDPGEVEFPEKFAVKDSGDTTNILTATSEPTIAQYKADVVAKKYLQVGEAVLTRWRGPIWQLATPFALAS